MTDKDDRQKRHLEDQRQRKRGERAEHVASWYFRLNGFLSIPGFIVHPDVVRRNPMTEADLIAVRFPHSREVIDGRQMQDDRRLLTLATYEQVLFLLVEVKFDLCKINGPWSDSTQKNMQQVIRRLGFANEDKIEGIAKSMYSDLFWKDKFTVLQYVAVGNRKNDGNAKKYPRLLQVTWEEIAIFLFNRFQQFPPKLPLTGQMIHAQWPDFGRVYGEGFGQMKCHQQSQEFVSQYIGGGPKDEIEGMNGV